jgi:ankyrin repeat protein
MHRAVAAFLLLILSAGCSVRPPDLNRVRIEYSFESEYGDSRYKLTIWGNGKVRYESDRGFGVPGVQEYFVPQARVAAMVNALNGAHFFSLPESLPYIVFDCSVIRIRYSDGRRNKLVIDNCRESIPKHRRGRSLAEAAASKDMEPGLWDLSKKLDYLAEAERFIHPGLTDYALLAAEGWNVNTSGKRGWTALDYALSRRDYLSAVFLLEHGAAASDDALIKASGVHDQRPLNMLLGTRQISQNGLDRAAVYAARSRNAAALERLLAAGANPNGDPHWGIPIFDAVRNSSGAAIDLLVRHGVDLNTRDEQGSTPLIVSATEYDSGIITQLIQLGAQIDARDRNGKTALMHASERCYYWTMIPLLEAGASLQGIDLQRHPLNDLCGPAGSEKAQRATSLLQAALKQRR